MPAKKPPRAFAIVGVGASAGGLEALEAFFANVRTTTTSAYVVVQHLDPTRKAMLVELLSRTTKLPVAQARDRMRIEPGHVYVIPPNKELSVIGGVLRLAAPKAKRGLRLPIDGLFRSLAADLKERSIGVVLSGMGSDGTLGLRAIREHAGAAFVQDPASAKFEPMPQSAISAGLADVVALPERLASAIEAYARHGDRRRLAAKPDLEPVRQSTLESIAELLRAATGHDFSLYKESSIERRVERRMHLHQLATGAAYVRYLRENPKELELLFEELLIGVTSFFRDPKEWERLATDVLPDLLRRVPKHGTLRAWVAACSTGEEAYSLAIALKETIDASELEGSVAVQIFATDIHASAIETARRGYFSKAITEGVGADRLSRFFIEEEHGYRVRKEIRDLVVFATQNVLHDPPFTKLDLLVCRNLFIYLRPVLQQKLIPLFHYSLNRGGALFLGSAETVSNFPGHFQPISTKSRIYRRIDTTGASTTVDFPSRFVSPLGRTSVKREADGPVRAADLQMQVEQRLLARFTPAAVLASPQGDILYVSGRTEDFLELPSGHANWNVFAMARDGLRQRLPTAFQEALDGNRTVELDALRIRGAHDEHLAHVFVEPVDIAPTLRETLLVVLSYGAPPAKREERTKARPKTRTLQHEVELRALRAEARATREQMSKAQEELAAANAELQSTNEELQSTNEELTTSKEEMQSMNEELQTLNHELQVKVDELEVTGNDMRNLLDSTEIAILFLDGTFNVRRFTPAAAKLIKLIPSDVGRPLADLASDLEYPALEEEARTVLRTLTVQERSIASRSAGWFNVRILPYRTSDNRIDGVVITFTPIQRPTTKTVNLRVTPANRRRR